MPSAPKYSKRGAPPRPTPGQERIAQPPLATSERKALAAALDREERESRAAGVAG